MSEYKLKHERHEVRRTGYSWMVERLSAESLPLAMFMELAETGIVVLTLLRATWLWFSSNLE